MKGIEINGKKLHEVGMHLKPSNPGTTMTLRYPKSQLRYAFEGESLSILVPSYLAVELYRKGVLPQDQDLSVPIKESGKPKGSFVVKQVIYSEFGDNTVQFTLQKNNPSRPSQ